MIGGVIEYSIEILDLYMQIDSNFHNPLKTNNKKVTLANIYIGIVQSTRTTC